MKKYILTTIIIIVIIGAIFIVRVVQNNKEETTGDFVKCLAGAGVVIYGSKTCPACAALVDSFGGYEKVSSIYVECGQAWERCDQEMQTNYVPEIQIRGELYTGSRSPEDIAKAVNCEI